MILFQETRLSNLTRELEKKMALISILVIPVKDTSLINIFFALFELKPFNKKYCIMFAKKICVCLG